MNNERAGDRVFADVDRALAERIVSRSKENSRETEPATGGAISPELNNTIYTDDATRPRRDFIPAIKIAAALTALLIVALLIFGRWGKRDD